MNQYQKIKKGEFGAWLSIIAYIVLALTKIIIAQMTHSQALRADGLNNATDVVASISILIGLKISRRPPDHNHHYGHFRAELIASLVAAFIMVTVGLQVIINAIQLTFSGQSQQPSMLAGWIALISACFMFGVYLFNRKLSIKINSQSLFAASQDNKADALISLAAFFGILGAQIGFTWIDPIAGLFVGIIIVYTAWKIFMDASVTLTDGFEVESVEEIKAFIEKDPDVKEVKDIKGRYDGNRIYLDLTLYVDPKMTIQHAHLITDRIESALAKQFDADQIQIHLEPYVQ
ncbi:cation diffusion facilitator family transporter [Amphibacillus xylanus]|uniref:Putative cation efflux protein n=1 Tax=Amphibacillus xylanus (strain ATCC 51415 / DSM 6626 / JCM 7361 / LMG 17667 / NBRC 15112 / Ep01) TaxID=698758 RepID=K0J536_AMPXN|nr:cation diffusion facilitator family transporter [Amphibacillus xylanus]BAM47981.1 putative cation efflux protein [Amphibacillus xylanus NBRC 15112]